MKPTSFLLGHVFHARSETATNKFNYPIFNIYFSLKQLDQLRNTFKKRYWRVLSLNSHDYIDSSDTNLKLKICEFAKEKFSFTEGTDFDDIFLQTIPRMFGYVFNPVSFWYFFKSQNLVAILCEVNNTFGEKHFYWLSNPSQDLNGQWMLAEKSFHVSPFFDLAGNYKFRFLLSSEKIEAHIQFIKEMHDQRLITWVKGKLYSFDDVGLLFLLVKYGWMTPLVVWRIHYQAIKLYFKKVKFYKKPKLPNQEVTIAQTHD